MGVDGLWKLIDKCGEPVSLDTLENKVLAIDTSIWLNQAVKGIRDRNGVVVDNAHLLGIFNRICKLLYCKIKPVFVFDGGVPALKRQTIQSRQRRTQDSLQKNQQKAHQIVKSYLEKQIGQRIQSEPKPIDFEGNRLARTNVNDELFLKPEEGSRRLNDGGGEEGEEEEEEDYIDSLTREDNPYFAYKDESDNSLQGDEDDDDDDQLDKIDIHSEMFSKLPAEVRHNVLIGLKEKGKFRKTGASAVSGGNTFSSYQLSNLIKSRQITKKIEETQTEMMNSYSGVNPDDYEGYSVYSKHVASEKDTKILYIKKKEDQPLNNNRKSTNSIKQEDYGQRSAFTKPLNEIIGTVSEFDYHKSELIKREGSKTIVKKESVRPEELLFVQSNSAKPSFIAVKSEDDEDGESDDDDLVSVDEMEDDSIDNMTFSECNFLLSNVSNRPNEKSENNFTRLKTVMEEDIETKACSQESTVQLADIRTPEPSSQAIEKEDSQPNLTVHSTSIIYSPKGKLISDQDLNENETTLLLDDSLLEMLGSEAKKLKTHSYIDLVSDEEKEKEEKEEEVVPTEHQNYEHLQLKKSPIPTDDTEKASSFSDDSSRSTTIVAQKVTDIEKKSSSPVKLAPIFMQKKSSPTKTCSQNLNNINEQPTTSTATKTLKDQHFEQKIDQEMVDLRNEIKKVQRQNNIVHKNMIDETKELLNLFGIPYLDSPMEAEAQCAALELNGLTEGTITDDSDVWLFGASTVYKSFFNQSKFVLKFTAEQIAQSLKLSRDNLICLAMLCGSDYTTGVHGIGPITAVEIISEFQGEALQPLKLFQEWWLNRHTVRKLDKSNQTRHKFIKYNLPDTFPSQMVFDAYRKPIVCQQKERFKFGCPDLDLLCHYAASKFGWPKDKSDRILSPVFKRLNDRQTQSRIDSFFRLSKKKEELFGSERLKKAIKKIDNQPPSEKKKDAQKTTRRKTSKKVDKPSQFVPTLKTRVRNQKLVKKTSKDNVKSKGQTKISSMLQINKEIDLSGNSSESS